MQYPSFGQTLVFDGNTTYHVSGFRTAEEALWAAFRGPAITYRRLRGIEPKKAKRLILKCLSRQQVAELDRIALCKLGRPSK